MTKHTILFLAANPQGADGSGFDPEAQRVALDQEASAIDKELRLSGRRDSFEFMTRWAAQPLDLLRELRSLKPTVIHFSGHGGHGGLFFQTPTGAAQLVTPAAIAEAFGAAGSSVRLVVLSASYSEATAVALIDHVDCVVGTSGVLSDDAAKAFARGFYGALGDLESVAAACQQGNAAISLEGLSEANRPQLKIRAGADATRMLLAATPVAPDLDRLIERVLQGEPVQTQTGQLPHRPWRNAQPEVANEIDRLAATDGSGFLVLTGEAGLGKSTVLEGIFRDLKGSGQQAMWLSLGHESGPAPNADQLVRMTREFGQRTAWSGRPCWLLVDGIDSVPDAMNCLKPSDKLRVVIGARTETYEPRRQFEATEIRLAHWPRGKVAEVFQEELPSDLATLLGNPFLLNLALEIPKGTVRRPTRFAILSRYLMDVVFGRGTKGVAARSSFDVMARSVARGDAWTTPPTEGLEQLLTRGIATAPGGGRARFTHPLFAEIAVTMCVAHRDASQCVHRLLRLRDSFLRASVLRMLLEGCVDVGDSARLLDLPKLGRLLTTGLEGDLDIVGGLAQLDIVVPEILQHPRSPDFCAQLFEAAKLTDQRSWLAAVASLDIEPTPPWAIAGTHSDALPQIAEHLVTCGATLTSDIRRRVAIRLRAWSIGRRSIRISHLIDVLSAELPDNETLDWMASIVAEDLPWASPLRRGMRSICSRGVELDLHRVRAILEKIVNTESQSDPDHYLDAHNLMLGTSSERGLFVTQPEIAIELLLKWQADETRRDREARDRRRKKFAGSDDSHDVEISDG
jgi:hypothetical protein